MKAFYATKIVGLEKTRIHAQKKKAEIMNVYLVPSFTQNNVDAQF